MLADEPQLTTFQRVIVNLYHDLLSEAQTGMGEGHIPFTTIVFYAREMLGLTSRAAVSSVVKGVRAIESGKFHARHQIEEQKEKLERFLKRSKGDQNAG